MAHCRVSCTGSDGTVHLVTVGVDSLYEAIALAVAEFRSDKLTDIPGPMTEFTADDGPGSDDKEAGMPNILCKLLYSQCFA